MLPKWPAQLRVLRLEKIRSDKFDFLVKIALGDAINSYSNEMNEMLEYNPQLFSI